jgi:hypothetical protein
MFPNCSHPLDNWRFFHPTSTKTQCRERAEKSSVQQLHPSQPNSRQLLVIGFLIPVPGVQVSPGVLAWRGFLLCARQNSRPLRPQRSDSFIAVGATHCLTNWENGRRGRRARSARYPDSGTYVLRFN